MQRIRRVIVHFLGAFASFALVCGIVTTNSACGMIFHQPHEPISMNKYKI